MDLDDGALYVTPRPRIVHDFAQREFFAYFREYRDRAADTLTMPLLPGFALPLADLFQHPHRPPHRGE